MGRKGRGHRGGGKPSSDRPGALRTCCGCGQSDERDRLVRLTVAPDGTLVVDLRGKLGGRGAWIHPKRSCVSAVEAAPGRLGRSLRAKPDTSGLGRALKELVVQSALDGLSMAAAAGLLIGGRERILSELQGGKLSGVVFSQDAADGTVEILGDALPAHVPATVVPLDTIALGARVGKGPRAALGVRHGTAARHLRTQLRRLRDLG